MNIVGWEQIERLIERIRRHRSFERITKYGIFAKILSFFVLLLIAFIGVGFFIVCVLKSIALILLIGVIWLAVSVTLYAQWIKINSNFYVSFAVLGPFLAIFEFVLGFYFVFSGMPACLIPDHLCIGSGNAIFFFFFISIVQLVMSIIVCINVAFIIFEDEKDEPNKH